MDGSIELSAEQRKVLLTAYRWGKDARSARRAHIVLLVAEGWSYREVRAVTFASYDLIRDCVLSFRQGGSAAVLREAQEQDARLPGWLLTVQRWLQSRTPQDFGYFRSRWSCAALRETLAWHTGIRLSGETIRRGLARLGWVWRRPRPVVGPTDPQYDHKLQALRDLLATLPENETALFQDEVDVNLNPKIGSCWMQRGQQAEVVTPGNNEKRHVAGSLHWRTGKLLVSRPGKRRNTDLFLEHLDDLRRSLRSYTKIHVICDNAAFHQSRAVKQYLKRWGDRIAIHFLPKYAPETNPVERVWWHFHETITRNHRCKTLKELLAQSYDWFQNAGRHYFEMRKIFPLAA
jgi:putative transposase